MIATAYVFVGDHSRSNSENWNLTIGDRTHSSPSFGEVQRDLRDFAKGESYDVTAEHAGTNRVDSETGEPDPDYDYRGRIDRYSRPRWTSGSPTPSGTEFFVTDSDNLFQRRQFSSGNPVTGKQATVHFPSIDLDIDSDSSGLLDGSLSEDVAETDSRRGAEVAIWGDVDLDSIPDYLDFDGITGGSFTPVEVSLSANLVSAQASNISLKFDFDDAGFSLQDTDGLFRLWTKDAYSARTANDLISAETSISATSIGLTPGQKVTLYLEAVNPTGRTVHYDPIKVSASVTGTVWSGELTDEVFARGQVFGDIDIADENGDFLCETCEDNIGAMIDLGLDKDELTKATFQSLIPASLDFAADFFTLDFEDSIIKIWDQVTDTITGLDSFEEVTSETQFNEADQEFSVWVEGFEVGATTISLVWHQTGAAGAPSHVLDSVAVETFGLRDVDILLAIDGTGSRAWLDGGAPGSPGGTGMTVDGGRWLSHLRNWTDQAVDFHYGDGPEDPDPIYLHGPDRLAFAQDAPMIIEDAYSKLSTAYWDAVATGAEPKVDILGMSRGGLIAAVVAWRINWFGYRNPNPSGPSASAEHGTEIRFVGLYDPVDQTETVSEVTALPPNVQHSSLGIASNFTGEKANEISRHYWDRVTISNASETEKFAATHSAIQGAPTYSTDAGSRTFTVIGGNTNHPSAWLDGYTDAADVTGAIAADKWFRTGARSVFVPIEYVENYHLNCLHADPNDESPNHEQGHCPNG